MADNDDTSAKDDTAPQDSLGEAGKKALDQERKARRDAERQLRDATERLRELETAELRREVAAEKNLTPRQARHLAGSTREELEANADDLRAAFQTPSAMVPSKPSPDLKSGGDPDAEVVDAKSIADRVLNRGF